MTKVQEADSPVAKVNVHQVKLKTRKEMERTIPRERLGWWHDVCPGQHMTLRDATAADLARYSLKSDSSKKPEDYLCELPEDGSLIHRDALQHCRTFAIPARTAHAWENKLVGLLEECSATLKMWADVAPAVSLIKDIDAVLASKGGAA